MQRRLERRFAWFASAIVLAAIANELLGFGFDVLDWDLLHRSGTATFLLGLGLGRSFTPRLHSTFGRLLRGETFLATPEQQRHVQETMSRRVLAWAHGIGLLIATAACVAFAVVVPEQPLFIVIATVGAYPVGRYIGEAVAYGGLGRICEHEGVRFALQAGHLDGAAGWRPVGDLYFMQTALLAIPAAFLSVWWFLIPAFEQYSAWRTPYAVLLVIVVAREALAFVLPLLSFHRVMWELKEARLPDADEAGHRVVELRELLAHEPDLTLEKGVSAIRASHSANQG